MQIPPVRYHVTRNRCKRTTDGRTDGLTVNTMLSEWA